MYTIKERFPEYDHGGLEYTSLVNNIILMILLVIFTIALALVGAIVTYFVWKLEGERMALIPIGCIVSVIGLILLAFKITSPERIVIDTAERRLYVLERHDTPLKDAPAISYDALECFQVRRHVAQRTQSGSNKRRVSYMLSLLKRDFVKWPLMRFRSQRLAEEARDQLERLMGWSGAPDEAESTSHGEEGSGLDTRSKWSLRSSAESTGQGVKHRFEVDRTSGRARIEWRITRSARETLGLNTISIGLATIAVGGFSLHPSTYLVTMGALIALALNLIGRSRFEPERWVEINRSGLRAAPTWALFGTPAEIEISADELCGVQLNMPAAQCIQLITHEVHQELREMSRDTYELDLVKVSMLAFNMGRLPKINISGLSLSEALTLELLLEGEFETIHGRPLL